ncbi:MAG: glycine cleavage system protein GcvH [Deltaproteobacteria bacterium]|jgi:glycine cleavage system H protein|nr:glycine cleavage system protein GcvH [Deltaproteobacteria bacterium]MDR1297918.1 glycine cleavage system protein GcvH [Deltaproteobacteria bacterium]
MKELSELNLPSNVKYHEEHEWVSQSAPFRLGISDFAQDALGALTFVELPEVGAKLVRGEEFGTLESTKSVSPLISPVNGTVKAVNEAIADNPDLVNSDPYGEGWIIEIEMAASELEAMLDVAAYKKLLEESAH